MDRILKVLLVEDDKVDQIAFERFVRQQELPYDFRIAGSTGEAGNFLKSEPFDVLLVDYLLGDGTAFDLFGVKEKIPIILMTGQGDEAIAVKAMKEGAYDYLTKKSDGSHLKTLPVTIEKVLERKRIEEKLKEYQENLEQRVRERTVELVRTNEQLSKEIAERERAEKELQKSLAKLSRTFEATVKSLATIVENKDPYTFGHQMRVAEIACGIAERLCLSENRITGMRIAALLHDIGKINVPVEILGRPGKLKDMETKLIEEHPRFGYEILKNIDFPWPIAQMVLQHHERLDGSGYPQGLLGESIIMEARIIGVADVFESISSHRPYRPARGYEAAVEEISKNKGVLYDPAIVDACLEVVRNGEAMLTGVPTPPPEWLKDFRDT